MATKTALVPIADGSEEIEAVSIIDILRRADVDVTVASVDDLTITASRGTKIVADVLIGTCAEETYDLIALPGGMPGSEHLRDSSVLVGLLKAQRDAGRPYGAICAAPIVVLQHHGLLAGKKATCHPGFADELQERDALAQRVVVDGSLVTSRGPGTAAEFALALVELLCGSEKADVIEQHMLLR
jgi:protein deglycase